MKHSIVSILLITMITAMTSLAANGKEITGKPTVIVAPHRTAIQNAQVRVNILKLQKPKLFVGNPHKVAIFADDYDTDFIEVDDIITSYRRRDLNKIEHEDGISDYVRWRLFLARQLAMFKYKEVHG